jgi:cell pole-organizing protein PopZ
MGDMSKEPSMEEILSSIKRIIAEEGEEAAQAATAPRRGRAEAAAFKPVIELGAPASDPDAEPAPAAEEILELTEEISLEEPMPAPKASATATRTPAPEPESILSVESEIAARQSLSALSSMLVASKDGGDNTLEGLVRSMLKPMLKQWLDARLPGLVEEMVAKEIARITGAR